MPRLLLCLAFVGLVYPCAAQVNLVPNPSFEDYNDCPVGISGFSYGDDLYADDWYSAGAGTSDYFHACAGPGSWVYVPDNLFTDDQPAHTGEAYGGFWVDLYDNNSFLYREYVQAELLEPLTAGECYYVEFWSAPATTSDFFGSTHATTDAIGAYLGFEKQGSPAFSEVLDAIPQIDNNATGNYIDPPGVWTRVSGFYTATGGEDWIVVGNFHGDDEVECVPYTGGDPDITPLVYLFVDDVLVTPVDSMAYLPDTISCNPVTLYAPSGADSYLWSTGATGSSIVVTTSGTYWVEFSLPCGVFSDTAFVEIVADSVYTDFSSLEICFTELPYTLEADPGYEDYVWSTGATTASIEIDAAGVYYVTGYADCATFVDSIAVSVIPPLTEFPDLGNDTLICSADWSLTLFGPEGYDTYLWSTGETTQNISVDAAGTYTLEVNSTCESFTDEIVITIDPDLQENINLGPDQILCPPAGLTPVLLDAGNALPAYTWSTGETTSAIAVTEPGMYFVYYESPCRLISDTVLVTLCTEVGVPSAFSPNDDSFNDWFTVIAPDPSVVQSFLIYNRWGELLFSGDAAALSWDGKFNGNAQPLGTYVYVLTYTDNGTTKVLQGNFTLVR